MFIYIPWRIHGAGIYANIKGVYWWYPWHTIYSSTMDPSWGYRSIFFATPSPRSKSWTPSPKNLQVLEIRCWEPQTLYPQLRCLHSNSLEVPVGWEGKEPSQVTNGYVDLTLWYTNITMENHHFSRENSL
jgi:hypothetical protein